MAEGRQRVTGRRDGGSLATEQRRDRGRVGRRAGPSPSVSRSSSRFLSIPPLPSCPFHLSLPLPLPPRPQWPLTVTLALALTLSLFNPHFLRQGTESAD